MRIRAGLCGTLGFAVGIAAFLAMTEARGAEAWFERPPPRAACAAFDLHLLGLIEEAGRRRQVPGARLAAAHEGIVRARGLCGDGNVAGALLVYEAFAVELAESDPAADRQFASLCGDELDC